MITFTEYKKKAGYVKFQGSVMSLRDALRRIPANTKVQLIRIGIHPNEILFHQNNGRYKIIETIGDWPLLRTRKSNKE